MSTVTKVIDQSNFLGAVTDISKIFLGGTQTISNSYINNSSYDPITLLAGTVMGRISSTGVLAPCTSNASDGSKYPIGILMQDLVIDSGDTVTACVCLAGRVAQEKVIFFRFSDSLSTVVDARQYRDRIGSDSVGILLVPSVDNSYADNY